MPIRALRGATTVVADSRDEVLAKTTEMIEAVYERNGLGHDDVISILFTTTSDIASVAPAAAARALGITEAPLLCAQEMAVIGSLPLCVRMMLHIETDTPQAELRHVFLHGAAALRPDLAGR